MDWETRAQLIKAKIDLGMIGVLAEAISANLQAQIEAITVLSLQYEEDDGLKTLMQWMVSLKHSIDILGAAAKGEPIAPNADDIFSRAIEKFGGEEDD